MNTRQLYYALQLSKTRNFSQVAEQLKITQPALSKQIISLETELGVKLFDRTVSPLQLTPAGEHFMHEAEALIYKEEQLLRSMEQYKSGEKGKLTIGISPFRSLYLIPPIVEAFKEKYPEVQITLREANSDTLRKEAAEGKYDFAIINLPIDDSLLCATPLEADTLVLVVPNKLLHLLPKETQESKKSIDFADCSKLPFVVVRQNQEMRHLFEHLCTRAGIHPHISMEVVGLNTAWSMTKANVGATLLPLQFVNNEFHNNNVSVFTINQNEVLRTPAIITRHDQYVSPYAQYAISLLTKAN